MLYDRDRSKISERAQHQIEKTGIQKISALGVAKIGTGQFAQSGREIAPGIRIGNWSEWRLKALPNRPGKDERDCSPIAKPPNRICSRPGRLPPCELRNHFKVRPNLGEELWFIARSCWLKRPLPSALPHLHDKFEDKPQAEKLRQQSRIHLHGHVTANLERNDGCHFKATGCVK